MKSTAALGVFVTRNASMRCTSVVTDRWGHKHRCGNECSPGNKLCRVHKLKVARR